MKRYMKESRVAGGRVGVFAPEHPSANSSGYVLRYRFLMEQEIGRLLTSEEIVHHVNGNPMDDRLENLAVITRGGHSSIHRHRKLDYDEVERLMKGGYGYKRIARILGYPRSSVCSACRVIKRCAGVK